MTIERETKAGTWSLDRIAGQLLKSGSEPTSCSTGCTRASVAMILHQSGKDVEVLFIQRAAHELDPWSGHIAFPGGKMEEGEVEFQTACRETLEETGIDLGRGRYLGRLSDIIGANLPVRVACCLFCIDREDCKPVLNDEVRDLFWVALSDLTDPSRHLQSSVLFDNRPLDVPSIRLPVENKPALWGITYRLVMQFTAMLEDCSICEDSPAALPDFVVLDETG